MMRHARYLWRRFVGYPVLRLNMRAFLWWMRTGCPADAYREIVENTDARIDLYCLETGLLLGPPLSERQ
jgi:hypothetical protein